MANEVKHLSSILKKMKVKFKSKDADDLKKTLEEACGAGKQPTNLSPNEIKCLKKLGYDITEEGDEEKAEKPAKGKKPKKAAKEEESEDEDEEADEEPEEKPKGKKKLKLKDKGDDDEKPKGKKKLKPKAEKSSNGDRLRHTDKIVPKGAARKWFQEYFKANKSATREDIFKAYTKALGKGSIPTCGNYLASAKKDANVLGFFLTMKKDSDGNKVYTRKKAGPDDLKAPKPKKDKKPEGKIKPKGAKKSSKKAKDDEEE